MNSVQALVYSIVVVVSIMSMRSFAVSRAQWDRRADVCATKRSCCASNSAVRCERTYYEPVDYNYCARPRCWDSLYVDAYGYADPYDCAFEDECAYDDYDDWNCTWRYPYWRRYGGCCVGGVGFGFGW